MADEKATALIAIDHGFSQIKTVDDVFDTAITLIDEPLDRENVLQLGSKFYRIGGRRIDVLENKTQTDDFRLLTYVAIARHLKRLNTRIADVILAVGLPIGRIAKEKESFRKYLAEPKEVQFKYSDDSYSITIDRSIFLPAAGYFRAHAIEGAGASGYYWSSTRNVPFADRAVCLYFVPNFIGIGNNGFRNGGFTIRPVCVGGQE